MYSECVYLCESCLFICLSVPHVCVCETDPTQISPVQQVTEAFCAVPLDDALSAALLAELEQVGGQLVT